MRVGLLPLWYLLLGVAVPSAIYLLIRCEGRLMLTSIGLACLAVWARRRAIIIHPEERILEVDGRRFPVARVVGVSTRSQLELVISIAGSDGSDGSEDIVLVPAALTDRQVVRRANELREALDAYR